MTEDKANTIYRCIERECQRDNLTEWCEDYGFTVDEFYEFLSRCSVEEVQE